MMPDRAALDELIAKLEAASEGSRELDCAIEEQIGGEVVPYGDHFLKADHMTLVPEYSRSIEAALPGEQIDRVEFSYGGGLWEARHMVSCTPDGVAEWTTGYGNTEALARRAAALKARRSPPEPAE